MKWTLKNFEFSEFAKLEKELDPFLHDGDFSISAYIRWVGLANGDDPIPAGLLIANFFLRIRLSGYLNERRKEKYSGTILYRKDEDLYIRDEIIPIFMPEDGCIRETDEHTSDRSLLLKLKRSPIIGAYDVEDVVTPEYEARLSRLEREFLREREEKQAALAKVAELEDAFRRESDDPEVSEIRRQARVRQEELLKVAETMAGINKMEDEAIAELEAKTNLNQDVKDNRMDEIIKFYNRLRRDLLPADEE